MFGDATGTCITTTSGMAQDGDNLINVNNCDEGRLFP